MVNETVPKDILDKLNAGIEITGTDVDIRDLTSVSDSVEVLQDTATDLKTEVYAPAGSGLSTLSYGSSDGGTTWYPIKVAATGVVSTDATITDPWKAVVDTGTLIIRQQGCNNSQTTLYTVPANKVLYVTAASLSWLNSTIITHAHVNLKIGGYTALELEASETDEDHDTISMSFPLPIRLPAGQIIYVKSWTSGLIGDASIVGYLVDA